MKAIITIHYKKVGNFDMQKYSEQLEKDKDNILIAGNKMIEDLMKELKIYYKKKKIDIDITHEIKW